MLLRTALITLMLTALSGLGGLLAAFVHTPLPFMLGSLLTSGAIALIWVDKLPADYKFPMKFRMLFMIVIGVMIGTRVTPEVISALPSYLTSFALLTVFVAAAHGLNYVIFRRLGGYDRATAFYSGTPGGLMESIAMGEAAGANIAILTMQQFLRIIAVITLVPVGLSIWYGAPVGSASGQTLARAGADLHALPLVMAIGLVGLLIGRAIRLPAYQLTGPLLAAAIVTVTGWADLPVPQWLVNLAQVVIGASLGMRFAGLGGRSMIRATWLALLSVAGMLALGLICALILRPLTGLHLDVLLISFAPGGVTEMALVALSLHANPAIVTLHHIYRIILTVVEMTFAARLLPPDGDSPQ
ncbi:AbrB family transcriptional regulator [Thalassobius vesicularis]|uniref:AbrB family transcriptional regulator n=1 Tax=Thalassobius vesicularis TaxID=1294297 RepID=A0A4S3MB91_9RHOB|nr:AbrB family transcriptional regulator [Thalassobius vesicularis]THD74843.1 AbrB family transcriptional regulator [Thalassobius vesicularis]